MEKSTSDKLSTAAVLNYKIDYEKIDKRYFVTFIKEYFNESYVADIDFHLKFRFLIFFYWCRVTDSLVISFNVEHRRRCKVAFHHVFSSEDLGLCSSSSSIASWLFLQ
ncbi:hypothetical protein T08_16467 [Trichinella sp. T8]|nr:hypothetical protein T08_16467 [Trichinella sp. T8]